MEVWHVVPRNDLMEHVEVTNMDECVEVDGKLIGDLICNCKCNPEIRFEGENVFVIHNAFDGRELFESDNDKYIFKNPPSLN